MNAPAPARPTRIGPLAPADAPAYRALMLAAYARHPEAFTSSPAERARLPLTWWRARLTADPARGETVWGAWQGQALVGALGLRPDTGERTRHRAELYGMVVAPPCRGLGLGRALLQAALEEARQRPGLVQLGLSVSATNEAARRCYAQAGFVVLGTEPRAVRLGDGHVDKLRMGLHLPATRDTLELADSELAAATLSRVPPEPGTGDDAAVAATNAAWAGNDTSNPTDHDRRGADEHLTLRLSAAQVWRQAEGEAALPGHLAGLSLILAGLDVEQTPEALATLRGRLRQARLWHPALAPAGTSRLPLPLPAAWSVPAPAGAPWHLALQTAQGESLDLTFRTLALHWPAGARWHESLAC